MGTAAGKNVEKVQIPEQLPGFRLPAPPTVYIDDMRPPVPWYQDDPPKDEFDWSGLSRDVLPYRNFTPWPSSASVRGSVTRTPSSVIRAASGFARGLTNKPMIAESGRIITFMNQEKTRSAMTSRAPKTNFRGFRHRIAVPSEQRLPFEHVDEHARNVGQQNLLTLSTLISYLKEPFNHKAFRETLIARALIVWLAGQKPKDSLIGRADLNTPKGLLLHIARGSLSHADGYTLLCREAGLQSVTVEGLSKSGDFETDGRTATTLEDTWTAVLVDGSWQIVHPYWICKGLKGFGASVRDWVRTETSKGHGRRKDIEKTFKETVKTFINEDFFMPAPEVFIYSAYADDNQWQLLPPELVVGSRDEFMSLPVIYPAFFRFGLVLTSKSSCVIKSTSGVCNVSMTCALENAHRLVLSYSLIMLSSEINNTEIVVENIQKFVISSRNENQFDFEVRFPFEGIFRLEVSGGFYGLHRLRLCHFKLVCSERYNNFKYLPFHSESLQFGQGPLCDEVGLLLPSLPNGVLWCYQENNYVHLVSAAQQGQTGDLCFQPKELTFKIDVERGRNTDFIPELNGFADDELSDEVSPYLENGYLKDMNYMKRKRSSKNANSLQVEESKHDLSKWLKVKRLGEDLNVTVIAPFDGDFTLVIWAVKYRVFKDGSKIVISQTPVCAYLLKTYTGARKETVPQKLARHELERATKLEDISGLETAISKANHVSMEQQADELVAARRKLEYLIFKRDIHYATHRRYRRIIHDLLTKIAKYRHKRTLLLQIRRLFSIQSQLHQLAECRHHLPELRDAVRELAEITDPAPEVHITVAAMFLVLGESEKHIDDWDYILEKVGHDVNDDDVTVRFDPPILRKVALISEIDPPKTTRRKILTLLNEFEPKSIALSCHGAGVIHAWVKKVMAILHEVDDVIEPVPEV